MGHAMREKWNTSLVMAIRQLGKVMRSAYFETSV